MINRRTFLAAAVSAAVLTGCAVGPDYDRPYVPVPKDYRHIQSEEADLGLLKARWWTEYNDPNLDFFVSKAIANNRTLQQTMANVERAAAQLPWLDPIFFRSLTTRAISESQKQA